MEKINDIVEEVLVPLAEISKILEEENLYLTYKNKKWLIYNIENNKLVKIIESTTLLNLVNIYNNKGKQK